MAAKTVLVFLYGEPPEQSGAVSKGARGVQGDDEHGDKGKPRRRTAGSSVKADGMGEEDQELPKQVAIVDDDLELRTMYSFVLEHLGYRTLVVDDGAEIVNHVLRGDAEAPDIILMDYRMPKMNGLEAAKRIIRDRPGMKIIISTADDSVKQQAISAGMTFLQKPFSLNELADAIKEGLGGSGQNTNP